MRNGIEIAGRHVVVVGRSDIVGKPMAIMLMQRGAGADATVTVCHSRTRDLPAITRQADILIVAIGQPVHHGRHGQARRGRDRRGHEPRRGQACAATSISPPSAKWPATSRPCPAASGR